MNDDARTLLLAIAIAAVAAAVLGWFLRGWLYERDLRRKQRFFGLPDNSECLLVVSREAGADGAVARNDVFALLELAALIKNCRSHARVISGETAQRGFGERTEFCLGGPMGNRRSAAHLHSLLPGVFANTDAEPGPDRGAFLIGTERYRLENGSVEHVLLARLTAGQEGRPVFLICGQRSITHQAAARYLARHHLRLARKYGGSGNFVLLLKVVNSQAYGPDVVELVADVTTTALSPRPKLTTSKED
ncbi:hypothetical protein [Streptomyces alkaliphilus]|uniref:Secreted protein n=1 Tax=Streptomyces alkaliphilus TaxID=1472722 RepID=A0A7W3TCG4_9ACTN|nr:hypothetical protein [Streptomyces alkaliphilus]MBB0244334.1 hypothetical protein [Streptomyces alkaliphilus]MQS07025.1 hypothetical protein [Streptomyces alkaliphilus]